MIATCYLIVGAIHHYYESRHRLFNDEQPERIKAAKITRLKSKKLALWKQL